jgi:hypothetical protein
VTSLDGAGPVTAETANGAQKIGTGERRKSSSRTSSESQAEVSEVRFARKRRGREDWLAIAEALEVGRTDVMRALNTNILKMLGGKP